MRCVKGNEIRVLSSGAGLYIGTVDAKDGTPYCRVSQEYYHSAALANFALEKKAFTVRNCMENQFCSGGLCLMLIPNNSDIGDHTDFCDGN